MINYKLVKVTIDALGLAEVIIDMIVRYHGLQNSIIINCGSLFTLKFWSFLYYFVGITRRPSTTLYLQMDCQTKRHNNTMEAYLQAFVNFKKNDWAQFLSMAEFAYNNTKNASTGYTLFEFNYRYHLCVFYKEDLDPRSKSKTIEKLSSELQKLMTVCQQNLHYAQKLQMRAHNKSVRL